MSRPDSDDIHEPYVRERIGAGDWPGLVRYWMAHAYRPALDAAIALGEAAASRGEARARMLADLLTAVRQNPLAFDRVIPKQLAEGGNQFETQTLLLLDLYPRVALCQMALGYSVEHQEGALREGVQAAARACQLSQALEDRAAAAFFLNVMARGLALARRLEEARAAFEEGLWLYWQLAQARPAIYQPAVAAAFCGLGKVLRHLNLLDEAQEAFEEGLDLYGQLAQAQPDTYRPHRALALISLSDTLRLLNALEKARAVGAAGLGLLRELARTQPDTYRLWVAQALHDLGNVLRDLNASAEARTALEEGLELVQQLERERPGVHLPQLASTFHNLGNVLCDLKALKEARQAYEKALALWRHLAQTRPDVYRPSLALTLGGLGAVLRALDSLDEAQATCAEGLELFRQLAEAQPDVYRPDLAGFLTTLGNVLRDLGLLGKARQTYEEAVQLYTEEAGRSPNARLLERLCCCTNLGCLRLRDAPDEGWPDHYGAREAFRQAWACAEELRDRFRDPVQRQRVQTETRHVYDSFVHTCVTLWEVYRDAEALAEAVEVAETSGARELMRYLADETLHPANSPPDHVEHIRTLRRRLRRALRLGRDERGREPDA